MSYDAAIWHQSEDTVPYSSLFFKSAAVVGIWMSEEVPFRQALHISTMKTDTDSKVTLTLALELCTGRRRHL